MLCDTDCAPQDTVATYVQIALNKARTSDVLALLRYSTAKKLTLRGANPKYYPLFSPYRFRTAAPKARTSDVLALGAQLYSLMFMPCLVYISNSQVLCVLNRRKRLTSKQQDVIIRYR